MPEDTLEQQTPPTIKLRSIGRRTLFTVLLVISAIVVLAYLYQAGYSIIGGLEPEDPSDPVQLGLTILTIVLTLWLVYMIPARSFDAQMKRHPENEGDLIMIKGLVRALFIIIIVFSVLSVIFKVGALLAVIGAFAGMFLGWSLQGPVSGFVAWILITIKRPFKVGDRVLFPSWGLIGDVLDVGVMHTRLNQVGGTVGGEDKSNREILIPNAALWANVIINYTSSLTVAGGEETQGARYVLDEVVVRTTYGSDPEEVKKILVDAAHKVTGEIINETGREPYIRCDMYDYGVYYRLRFMNIPTDRPRIQSMITDEVVKAFNQSDKVDFAIPWVYSFKKATGKIE
jgi:small-conductance mechanosensitive channel